MPRFFFDIHDGAGSHRDHAGDECADVEEACALAQAILPDIARGEPLRGDLYGIVCDVRDETGRVVYRGEMTYRGTRDPA